MSKQITFYYDPYEKTLGDGNYPQLQQCESCSSSIEVEFRRVWIEIWNDSLISKPLLWIPKVWETNEEIDNYKRSLNEPDNLIVEFVWKQMNWDSIKGLDGDCGSELFKLLESDKPKKCKGIVNLNGKFIYTLNTVDKLKAEKEKAISTVKFHTSMPYVLGGSVAKYQGFNETMKYLERAHKNVFSILSKDEIIQIINETIKLEQT
jgi:hypothetical protein